MTDENNDDKKTKKNFSKKDLIRELQTRTQAVKPSAKVEGRKTYGFEKHLAPKQEAFVYDGAKYKTALCGRGTGKSFACCVMLLQKALDRAYATCVYIARTRKDAKNILWRTLQEFNDTYDLGINFNGVELIATLPNGSEIRLTGAKDETATEDLRGISFDIVIIDEAASFGRHLKYLIDEVVQPRTYTYNAPIVMCGTPSAACSGYFFEATNNLSKKRWANHTWTLLDNPYEPRLVGRANWQEEAVNILAALREENGWDADNPVYRREYLAQWVKDSASFVYAFTKDKNTVTTVPDNLNYVFGVDIGTNDPFAIVVWAYGAHIPTAYVVDTYTKTDLDVTGMATALQHYESIYKPESIVADAGALGKTIVMEMNNRHGFSIKPAVKSEKASWTELINSDLFQNRIQVADTEVDLIYQLETIQWDEKRKSPDPRYENDLADAFQYGYTEVQHYLYKEPVKRQTRDVDAEVEAFWRKEMLKMEEKENPNTWWVDVDV